MKINKTLIPSPLQRGATIGIVAPAGRIHSIDLFEKGVRVLHEMGFQTKFPRELWPGSDYFSDNDTKRSFEFNKIWNDPEVDAVMAARGGYGCIRMASDIDTQNIKRTPKFFIGFSDITLLHSYLNTKAGLVTFHGPVVTSLSRLSKQSISSLQSLFFSKINKWRISSKIEILKGADQVSGISTGGNLSTIISTLGTQFDTSWKGKIVFLEDTNEPLYRIDRMFTQLSLAGKFVDAAAIVLGNFSHGFNMDKIEAIRHHESVWKRVMELTPSQTTVWADFPFGHGDLNLPIPLGADLLLNSKKGEIRFC